MKQIISKRSEVYTLKNTQLSKYKYCKQNFIGHNRGHFFSLIHKGELQTIKKQNK